MAQSVVKMERPSGERVTEKRRKFVNLAQSRTVNAIRAIRVIGKLGNPHAYEYDESDVRKIVRALHLEIEALKSRMSSTKPPSDVDFSL
jgi:hypothetical protein